MMSDYQRDLLQGIYGGESNKVEKLVPNLRNKTKYILHYRNLQLHLPLGMKLTKIHRVLQFDQSLWVTYIHKNTELRKQATCDSEKDLFKLLNNNFSTTRSWQGNGKYKKTSRRQTRKIVRGEQIAQAYHQPILRMQRYL